MDWQTVSGIYVPVCWQIYARHGKASGQTIFPWFKEKKILPLVFSCQA
jgi:hypothetical protein